MIELLKTFDPDSQILIKVFPDNVDLKVVGKHCFEKMKQHKNVDNSFSQFDLRYGTVAITPGFSF